MGGPAFCICEDKGADRLRGNREADRRLCFRHLDSTIPPNKIFRPLAIFIGCIAWFVSVMVGDHFVGFLMSRLKYRS